MKKTKPIDEEPLTWVCECGQVNLWDSMECYACAGNRDECWDETDKAKAIWRPKEDGGYELIGFDT